MIMQRRGQTRPLGFTLIELMIVIAIISVLAVALLPHILGASVRGEISATQVRMQFLRQAIEVYARRNGQYPPDDFVDPDPQNKIVATPDAINPGIESLVIYLSQKRIGNDTLGDHEDWLTNTDGDKNKGVIPLLGGVEKMEVVDAWGTPFVYFNSGSGAGYGRAQRVRDSQGIESTVKAVVNPRTNKFHAPGKYQIISAGPDGIFGPDADGETDDLVVPPLPRRR